MSRSVGFIGLGTMGMSMARNLAAAGFSVTFFARRDEVAFAAEAFGAKRAATPAAVAAAADIVCTIVTADEAVREVVLGHQGVIESAREDKLLIDFSTISPDTVRQVATKLSEHGMAMIDAPVSGGPWGAEAATLTIMAGGNRHDFTRAEPILQAVGKKIFHLGPLGAGQTVKLVNQMLAAGIMCLIGEGLSLAQKAGADLNLLADVITAGSSGNSVMFEMRAKQFVIADDYPPKFTTALMQKDLRLALEMARHLDVPMPLAAAAYQQYIAAINQGNAGKDFASVAKVCQQAAGLEGG